MINNRYLNTYFNNNLESIISTNTNTKIDKNSIILDDNIDDNIDDGNNIKFFDTIIQHPYIDNINIKYDDILKCSVNKRYNVIIYRINNRHELPYVEFYLDNIHSFQSILLGYINNIYDINYEINKQIHIKKSIKKIQGVIKYNGNDYLIIQNRYETNNNYEYTNWLTIYDIIVNKHFFGEYISKHIIDFFIHNFKLSNLFISDKLVSTPIILYTYVDGKYLNYVLNNNSVMFCQNETCSYVKLRTYKKEDNVRIISFIDDINYNDNINSIENNNYIMINSYNSIDNITFPEWVFRNENKNIYCKK